MWGAPFPTPPPTRPLGSLWDREGVRGGQVRARAMGSRNSCWGITNEAKTVERSAERSSPD